MKKELSIRQSAGFTVETLQARRGWHDISNVLKEKNKNPKPYNQKYSTQQDYRSELKEK